MNFDSIIELRHTLHNCPELSGQELKTKATLIDFLTQNTSLEIHSCGNGFYAAHRESSPCRPSIALRADYDAVPMPDGSAGHLCGHDGHAAALCGVALAIEGNTYDRNIFLLFQPAEETGEGAEGCLELFEKENIDEIYGAHNFPGLPLGQVTTRLDTFACGSHGLTLHFQGIATHAAHPENGISPAAAVGKLLCQLSEISSPEHYTGITFATVIGVEMGKKAFGCAASAAEIWLTLRAEHDVDLEILHKKIVTLSDQLAQEYQLEFSYQMQDVFPATTNNNECAKKVLDTLQGVLMETPMRGSEDFGHYLRKCPGAYFGIGSGEDQPALHTENFEYPDALLQPAVDAFLKLLCA